MNGYNREVFENETGLLPELEIFGWLRFRETLINALKPDRHADALEIHYMKRGHLRWWVGDEQMEFSTGQVFIVLPGELHGGDGGAIQPCEHYWLRLRLPAGKGLLPLLSRQQTRQIVDGYRTVKRHCFGVSTEVSEFFERLHEEHRAPERPQSTLMGRAMLHALLITILRDHGMHSLGASRDTAVTWQVRRALAWLDENYREPDLKVAQLAAEFGRSSTALRGRFKIETGYTPHEYVLRRRIEDARRGLEAGDRDITTIAHELGFSSSQYFATVFRRHTGMSPSVFRMARVKSA
ncbi:MAG: AraC family transcriptional regulator [Opitutaceae bacterium]